MKLKNLTALILAKSNGLLTTCGADFGLDGFVGTAAHAHNN